jgi:Transposase domain (DUF772)
VRPEGADRRGQSGPRNSVVAELDLVELRFGGVDTGRPSYRPSVLLKLYIYGYLNRVQSRRRLEREAGRNFTGARCSPGRLPQGHCAPVARHAQRSRLAIIADAF